MIKIATMLATLITGFIAVPRRVFVRITYRVAGYRCLMRSRTLSTKVAFLSERIARLLLRDLGIDSIELENRLNCCLPGPSASPKGLADVHSASLCFFVVSHSGRPRGVGYENRTGIEGLD
jgi:hypothetical protein